VLGITYAVKTSTAQHLFEQHTFLWQLYSSFVTAAAEEQTQREERTHNVIRLQFHNNKNSMPCRMRATLCVAFTCVALAFAVVHSTLRVYWTHVRQYRCAVIIYQVLTKADGEASLLCSHHK
jgi:hypothetical protein